MKSYIEETNQKQEGPKYPILKKLIDNKVLVVLFTAEYSGTCLFSSTGNRAIGEVSNSWASCLNETVWEDFKGKIILEN